MVSRRLWRVCRSGNERLLLPLLLVLLLVV